MNAFIEQVYFFRVVVRRDGEGSVVSREERKKETAKAIRRAALEEFGARGFEKANVRAIAARAKVSAGTVIHHFGSKRELLYAALFDDLEETLQEAMSQPEEWSFEERLAGLTEKVFSFYRGDSELSRTLLKESLFAEPPWAERFQGQVGGVHQQVAKWAEEAKARGELEGEVDVAVLGMSYLSFYYFGLLSWVQGGVEHPEAMVKRQMEQHLNGLRRRSKVESEKEE